MTTSPLDADRDERGLGDVVKARDDFGRMLAAADDTMGYLENWAQRLPDRAREIGEAPEFVRWLVDDVAYRDDPDHRVVAFTAQQIPNISGRTYPASLVGERYPDGIPIHDEDRLEELIASLEVATTTPRSWKRRCT